MQAKLLNILFVQAEQLHFFTCELHIYTYNTYFIKQHLATDQYNYNYYNEQNYNFTSYFEHLACDALPC